MNFLQILRMSLQEIKDNKLRSFLTILGTAIGTASIILFVTISIGSREKMYQEMSLSSPKLIKVDVFQFDENKTVTYDEAKKLLNSPYVDSISPLTSTSSNTNNGNSIKENASILGVDENYSKFSKTEIQSGRDINSIDIDDFKKSSCTR